jgi:acyl carrier protein
MKAEGRPETSARVKEIIAEVFHKNAGELSDQTSFVKDLHAKSANMLEVIALLEEEFGLELRFADVMKNDTVGKASRYIEDRLSSK